MFEHQRFPYVRPNGQGKRENENGVRLIYRKRVSDGLLRPGSAERKGVRFVYPERKGVRLVYPRCAAIGRRIGKAPSAPPCSPLRRKD